MREYDFKENEKKWQAYWEKERLHETDFTQVKNKLYVLVMFIYPSGEKLHIGHWYNYAPTDTWARFNRLRGQNVFQPIGYDAFGLPAENYAIKHGVHPAKSTRENITIIRNQLKAIGAMYDWRAEVDTSSPEYYKWTQWVFLQLYNRGLAYRRKASVNWCPSCKTVLANEQVVTGGVCERCSSEVRKKDLVQWFFKITDYAERLLSGLETIDWPEKTKAMQRNWIGRSEGAEVIFEVPEKYVQSGDGPIRLPVFTTRPDTLFGATYMVLAPEHPAVEKITTSEQVDEVTSYRERARVVSEIERTSTVREKSGVFTGAYAINPANREEIPVWISDYILMTYGTGAIMAVPAHDERDFEFAVKFELPIIEVIKEAGAGEGGAPERAYTGSGTLVNSSRFTGMNHEEGAREIVKQLGEKGLAGFKINFKLRDWLISRQRYWGAPIPILYCESCGEIPVPEEELPVLLPEQVDFTPAGDGKSPLAHCEEFINTTCPRCHGEARRESDTMDTFVCSSWYFLRYFSPKLNNAPFDTDIIRDWLPVDQYVGGAEHAVMHLLYARFVTMVLHDLGYIHFEEPFLRLKHQGTITNHGAKMSKSRGNVVNPEHFLEKYGSDTFRMYLMFMGSYEEGGDWDDSGINGIHRFLGRIWRFFLTYKYLLKEGAGFEDEMADDADREVLRILHYTVKSVTFDLESFEFNTAISRMMELVNTLYKYTQEKESFNQAILREAMNKLNILLAPFAPHLAEELWQVCGGRRSVFLEKWPDYSEELLIQNAITIAVQINGRLRSELNVMRDLDDDAVVRSALKIEKIKNIIGQKQVRKTIVVKNKIVNLVV